MLHAKDFYSLTTFGSFSPYRATMGRENVACNKEPCYFPHCDSWLQFPMFYRLEELLSLTLTSSAKCILRFAGVNYIVCR